MNKIYIFFVFFSFVSAKLFAQQSAIPKNTLDFVPWTTDVFTSIQVGVNDWSDNNSNVLLNNNNTANGGIVAVLDTQDSLRVVDTQTYSAGNIVGFRGAFTAIGISIEISTWNGSAKVDSKTFSGGLLGLVNTVNDYTLVSTAPYNAVQIKISGSLVAGFNARYAVVKAYENINEFPCNAPTVVTAPDYPFALDTSLTKNLGITLTGNFENVIIPSVGFSFTSVLAGGVQLAFKDQINTYLNPHYVGFDITSSGILNLSALGTMEIRTYLNGVLKETVNLSSPVVNATVLNANTQRLGFVTTQAFNTIQFYQFGVEVSVGSITINNLVMTEFCAAEDLKCNELENLNNPDHSVYINSIRTGVSGTICANCTINGSVNLLDNNPATNVQINTLLSVGTQIALSVKDAMRTYPSGTYAGFDIDKGGLLDLGVLSGYTIQTYLNNVIAETFSGASLLMLGTSIIGGNTSNRIGILAGHEFDEIRFVLDAGVTANVGTTIINNVFITNMCDGDALICNTPGLLGFPDQPVFINSANTSFDAGVCVECKLNNLPSIVDGDPATSASIVTVAGVLSTAKISIKKAATPFAANTLIGIPFNMQSLLNLDLLNNITLYAYLDGDIVSQADASSGALLNVNSGVLFSTGRQTIAIVPNTPFDEIIMEITIPTSVNAGVLEINDVIVQQLCNKVIDCDKTIYLNNGNGVNGGMPVYVNYGRTGGDGLACVGCVVENPEAVISENTSDHATLNVTVAGVGGTSISVVDAMNVYPFATYAGFTIEAPMGIAQLDLFANLEISTYLNGELQEIKSANDLLNLTLLGLPIFSTGSGMYNVGFRVNLPFNEVRITSGGVVGVGLIDGIKVYGAWVDTRESIGGSLYCHKQVNPDMNAVLVGYTLNGKLSTNDIMPQGTVYSSWIADENNPSIATFTTQPDGSYTFSATETGEYIYFINVCANEELCYPSFVKITVTTDDFLPDGQFSLVANPDYANVLSGSSATLNVIANDAAGSELLSIQPSSLRISTINEESGKNGVAIVNGDGTITYTPNPGFIGVDSVRYFISDNQSTTPNESSAWVVFNVYPSDYVNTVIANNDFKITKYRVTGSLVENDQDPEGDLFFINIYFDNQKVSNNQKKKNIKVAAKTVNAPEGILEIEEDGTYSFTPAVGFKGTFQYVYTIMDENPNQADASATLVILVSDSYTLPIVLESFDAKRINGRNKLQWKTSSEENASHFVIERSVDGIQFNEIGRVEATNKEHYSFEDIYTSKSKVYYRLKLVDLDNTYKYSSIKVIESENPNKLSVFPNPAINGTAYLNSGTYSGIISIMIMDVSGKKISQMQKNVQQNETVSLKALPTQRGIYYIVVLDAEGNRILQEKLLNY